MIRLFLPLPYSTPFLRGHESTDLTLIPLDDTKNTERGSVWFLLLFVWFLRGEGVEWAVCEFNFGPVAFEIPMGCPSKEAK